MLNVGGVIDTKFLREQDGIGAVLLMSQAGNIGGDALADVLTGQSDTEWPSGSNIGQSIMKTIQMLRHSVI